MNRIFYETYDRRAALKALGLGLTAAPVIGALASSSANAASVTKLLATPLPTKNPLLKWAGGGAAFLKDKVYANPFLDLGLDTCALKLTCAQTLGPCYSRTFLRKDISEGQPGIPMRMAFRVLDVDCKPVKGAIVDVWHTSATGFYSGKDAADMCTLDNQEAVQANWFRGVQITDEDGRVDFDSCFPGWYSGRCLHIHFNVRVGRTSYLTSQLYWDDKIGKDIVANYPVYKDRGQMDTDNTQDGIFPKENPEELLFDVARMEDGAMVSYKTLILRKNTKDPICYV